jgi:hypothetical protein
MAARGKRRSARTPEEKLDRETRALELRRTRQLIKSLRGCCKGEDSLIDALHRERQEKSFAERTWETLSKSVQAP